MQIRHTRTVPGQPIQTYCIDMNGCFTARKEAEGIGFHQDNLASLVGIVGDLKPTRDVHRMSKAHDRQ